MQALICKWIFVCMCTFIVAGHVIRFLSYENEKKERIITSTVHVFAKKKIKKNKNRQMNERKKNPTTTEKTPYIVVVPTRLQWDRLI